MTPTSILEESKRINEVSNDGFQGERDFSRSNAASTDPGTNLTNQREQSMAFIGEGLEYFGPTFIHDASKMQMSPLQYIDPYELLEDERISQMARPVK
ncbi:hypothetical protein CRG98_019458 [Punica granatum]|nr:hypothetical protein CRG98_019458 [Punica granatum]